MAFLMEMEIDRIEPFCSPPRQRVYLRGDELCGDYLQTFAKIKETYGEDVELCPSNRFHCATALAVEWVTSGMGNNVVSSFCGIGNFAATEELVMILRKNEKAYKFFPEMAKLFCKITGKKVLKNKPILGKQIFNVESGIHVDGILKFPECYEPFPPEIVGQNRKIVLGKQSGKASIRAKLIELNMQCSEKHISHILEQVKAKNGAITKREFIKIAKECLA
jgi:homocitrate synthase NifV